MKLEYYVTLQRQKVFGFVYKDGKAYGICYLTVWQECEDLLLNVNNGDGACLVLFFPGYLSWP